MLPAAGAAAAATDLVSFARVAIENGSLVVADRAGDALARFDEISATGEVNGRQGPTRIDATLRQDGSRWRLRASAGRFGDDGTGRVRMTLERAADGVSFDADGSLTLAGITPRFDGKVVAAKRGTLGVPWQVSANAQATEEMVSLESFELTVGADAASAEVGGQVRFAPRRGGPIDGMLTARRIDFDSASGVDGPKTLPAALASARDALAALDGLPFRGRIGVAVESIAAGGNTIREFSAELGLREGLLALERLDARLPGRGVLKAKGSTTGATAFSGDASIEAEDAAGLARWVLGGPARSTANPCVRPDVSSGRTAASRSNGSIYRSVVQKSAASSRLHRRQDRSALPSTQTSQRTRSTSISSRRCLKRCARGGAASTSRLPSTVVSCAPSASPYARWMPHSRAPRKESRSIG